MYLTNDDDLGQGLGVEGIIHQILKEGVQTTRINLPLKHVGTMIGNLVKKAGQEDGKGAEEHQEILILDDI